MGKKKSRKSYSDLRLEIEKGLSKYELDAAELSFERIQTIRDRIYKNLSSIDYYTRLQLILKEMNCIHKEAIKVRRLRQQSAIAVKSKNNFQQYEWTDPDLLEKINIPCSDRLSTYISRIQRNIEYTLATDDVEIKAVISNFIQQHSNDNENLQSVYFPDSFENWCNDVCNMCVCKYDVKYGKAFKFFFEEVLEQQYYKKMIKYKMKSTEKHEAKNKVPIFVYIDHLYDHQRNDIEVEMQINDIDKIIEQADLQKFISTLTQRQQQIIMLKLTKDLTQDEIATILNVSTKTIKREFSTLKEMYSKYFS